MNILFKLRNLQRKVISQKTWPKKCKYFLHKSTTTQTKNQTNINNNKNVHCQHQEYICNTMENLKVPPYPYNGNFLPKFYELMLKNVSTHVESLILIDDDWWIGEENFNLSWFFRT